MRLKKVASRKRGSLQGQRGIQGASADPHSTQGHALPCTVVPLPASCHNSLLCNGWGLGTLPKYLCPNLQNTRKPPRIFMPLCLDSRGHWIRNEWVRDFPAKI